MCHGLLEASATEDGKATLALVLVGLGCGTRNILSGSLGKLFESIKFNGIRK